jgi:hypothetical protein
VVQSNFATITITIIITITITIAITITITIAIAITITITNRWVPGCGAKWHRWRTGNCRCP